MKTDRLALAVLLPLAVLAPSLSSAAELKPETLKAWNAYLRGAELRQQARVDGSRPFLWADEKPGRTQRLRQGEILAVPVDGKGFRSVPDGLIHDWIGAAFIPNVTLGDVLNVVHDYGRYKDYYRPIVVDSQVLACSHGRQEFSMRWLHKVLFVTAALDSRYESRDFRVGDNRWYTVSATTSVQEIADYGEPGQYDLPPGQGSGFIWRLSSVARYEERDGGVYVELEALALTRDIPFSLRWLVAPVVSRLSRNSLLTSLQQTKDAVQSPANAPSQTASCGLDWSAPEAAPVSGN